MPTCLSISSHLIEPGSSKTKQSACNVQSLLQSFEMIDRCQIRSWKRSLSLSFYPWSCSFLAFSPTRHVSSENVISVWSRNPANGAGGHPIHNLSDKIGRVPSTTILNLFLRASLSFLFLSSFVSPLFFHRVRINLTDTIPRVVPVVPTVVRVASTKVFRIVSLTVSLASFDVILGTCMYGEYVQ